MNNLISVLQRFDPFEIALIVSLPRIYAFMNSSQLLSKAAVPGLPRSATILSLTLMVVPPMSCFSQKNMR